MTSRKSLVASHLLKKACEKMLPDFLKWHALCSEVAGSPSGGNLRQHRTLGPHVAGGLPWRPSQFSDNSHNFK